MRTLQAATAALLLAGFVVVGGPGPAWACSCVRDIGGSEDDYFFRQADVVFTGTLTERREPPFSLTRSSADPATFVFRVEAVHKGRASRVQGLTSAMSGASCGIELPEGRSALVFAERRDGELTANLCGGSRVLAGDETPFDTVADPREGSSIPLTGSGLWLSALGAAAVVLAGVGFLVARRRHPR